MTISITITTSMAILMTISITITTSMAILMPTSIAISTPIMMAMRQGGEVVGKLIREVRLRVRVGVGVRC